MNSNGAVEPSMQGTTEQTSVQEDMRIMFAGIPLLLDPKAAQIILIYLNGANLQQSLSGSKRFQ